MEPRSRQARFDQHQENIQRLLANDAKIKTTIEALDVDRVESTRFQNFMMN